MEQCVAILITLAVMTLSVNTAAAQSKSSSSPSASGGFEKLKSLVGEWQGKNPEGQPVTLSFQLISGGSALQETMISANEPNMVTIYHPNGNKLQMTHYCSAGNQPRMQAEVPAGDVKILNFVFLDGANMAKHSDGHIHSLTLTFQDKDNITQEWTWRDNGKDTTMKVNLARKK